MGKVQKWSEYYNAIDNSAHVMAGPSHNIEPQWGVIG